MTSSRATIPLILFTLALSFAAVALIINGALSAPTIEEISASCGEQFFASQEPASCPAIETEIPESLRTTIPATTTYPGFSYPLGINAIAEETISGTTITLTKSGLFFSTCLDCTNDVIATLSTAPFTLTGTETLDAFVQKAYADNTSAVIKKEVRGNGTQYTITGTTLDVPAGPFTHVRFFGATTEAFVLLPAETVERDAFLDSLDFSLIP